MNGKHLKEIASIIPDDATIYVEADHGQSPEQASGVRVCVETHVKMPFYGDDLEWEDVESTTDWSKVTAVKIR